MWAEVGLKYSKCEAHNNKVSKFSWRKTAFKIIVVSETFSNLSDVLFAKHKAVVTQTYIPMFETTPVKYSMGVVIQKALVGFSALDILFNTV